MQESALLHRNGHGVWGKPADAERHRNIISWADARRYPQVYLVEANAASREAGKLRGHRNAVDGRGDWDDGRRHAGWQRAGRNWGRYSPQAGRIENHYFPRARRVLRRNRRAVRMRDRSRSFAIRGEAEGPWGDRSNRKGRLRAGPSTHSHLNISGGPGQLSRDLDPELSRRGI